MRKTAAVSAHLPNFTKFAFTMHIPDYDPELHWKNIMSNNFSVTNGVRQGGILSPCVCCVYMDDLSNKLNNVNAGCIIGSSLINHLMYADDLVLMHLHLWVNQCYYLCVQNVG